MAAPGPSSAYPAYPSHPPTGGKGLPPPAHFAQPTRSQQLEAQYGTHIHGNPPDLEHRFRLKVRYLKIQAQYFRSIEVRKDLELELAEKEAKQQKLQDEVDLILDQIHQSDYAHLRPKHDNLFSDDEDEVDQEPDQRIKQEPELAEEESKRRKVLEQELGVDSNGVSVKCVAPTADKNQSTQSKRIAQTDESLPPQQPQSHSAPNPKRIKLTFGSNGGAAAVASSST
ncbi:uncharacterized protein JCM15063_001619 [Sporobolomyces koalae]|uniref:uncharacterized protein n=1 Tax=Sporobolomyces koalae TaxID=500713 RepID=UPI00317E4BCD